MIPAERILVRGPNWLGDLVMTTPAFRALRAGYPDAEITLHARPALLPLLEGAPWFDRRVALRSYHRGPLAIWQEGLALRAGDFELGLCLTDSWSSALLMRVACSGITVGYSRGGRRALLDRAIPAPPWLTPREHHALGLIEALGCPSRGDALELHVSERQVDTIDACFAREGVNALEPLVLCAPGASYGSAKRWPAPAFAACADALVERGAQVALIGAPGEESLGRAVTGAMKRRAWDLTGRFDLGETAALVKRSQLVVCSDAGARHLAVGFGVPCIALFGPTSVAKTALNLERVSVVTSEVGCRPCYHRDCPTDHRCMNRIEPTRVVLLADGWLAASVPAAKREPA